MEPGAAVWIIDSSELTDPELSQDRGQLVSCRLLILSGFSIWRQTKVGIRRREPGPGPNLAGMRLEPPALAPCYNIFN